MATLPDYTVGGLNKTTGDRNAKLGAAWRNADGSITVKLDAFIVLHGGPDLLVRLFPRNIKPGETLGGPPQTEDEEIPF